MWFGAWNSPEPRHFSTKLLLRNANDAHDWKSIPMRLELSSETAFARLHLRKPSKIFSNLRNKHLIEVERVYWTNDINSMLSITMVVVTSNLFVGAWIPSPEHGKIHFEHEINAIHPLCGWCKFIYQNIVPNFGRFNRVWAVVMKIVQFRLLVLLKQKHCARQAFHFGSIYWKARAVVTCDTNHFSLLMFCENETEKNGKYIGRFSNGRYRLDAKNNVTILKHNGLKRIAVIAISTSGIWLCIKRLKR